MRTAEEMDLRDVGERLLARLDGRTFGALTVLGGDVEVRPDSDDELAVFLTLALPPPPPPTRQQRSWPRDDLWAVREAFTDALAEIGNGTNAYLYFTAVSGPRRADSSG